MAKGIIGMPGEQGNSEEIVSAVFTDPRVATIGGFAVSQVGVSNTGQAIVGPFDGANFFGFVNAADYNAHAKCISITRKGLNIPILFTEGSDFSDKNEIGLNAEGYACAVEDAIYVLNAQVRKGRENIPVIVGGGDEKQAVAIDLYGGGAAASGGA